jgi:hypothetical protein
VRGQMSVNAITGGQQARDGRSEVEFDRSLLGATLVKHGIVFTVPSRRRWNAITPISHACIFRVRLHDRSSLDCTSAVTMLFLDPFFLLWPVKFLGYI